MHDGSCSEVGLRNFDKKIDSEVAEKERIQKQELEDRLKKLEGYVKERVNESAFRKIKFDKSWLDEVGDMILQNKIDKGWKITTSEDWKDKHEIPAVLMLIVSEVSEALEAFRKDDMANFQEELADVMIRTIGLAHGLNIDLQQAVANKIEKNSKREFQHGGKKI